MTFPVLPQALVQTIGAAGAVLTTVCWVPQATKIIRDRDTRAISLPGTTLCVVGVLLWLVYGLAIVDGPLIGSSVVTLAITSIILCLKIRHGVWSRASCRYSRRKEAEEALEQLQWARRAALDVQIDGNDGVDAADDGIAVGKN